MDLDHQCSNNACSCKVESKGGFCGDGCQKQAQDSDQPLNVCECQHVDCGVAQPGKQFGTKD